jgi:twitching motility protein PilT
MTKRLSPDPDLEQLIRKLNLRAREVEDVPAQTENAPDAPPGVSAGAARWKLVEPTTEGESWLEGLLEQAREHHASDLLLVAGSPPVVRIHGRLEPLGSAALSAQGTALLCAALVPGDRRAMAESQASVDFSIRRSRLGRFRCNVHRQRDRWAAAIRLFPRTMPDLEPLNLPASLTRFAELDYGLVLVTGPTGSGKSTTLAALIRQILARRAVHLVTIEDPVEYEHAHSGSVVEHIEIGRDVPRFGDALRSVLRQDPDVLLIGEMRDTDSMSIAISAAETGHLVLSTLHTGDSPRTIHRILDSFPANQMDAVRAQLASSLAGIVSQQLLPRRDGKGRVPAVEVLVATPAVRNLIRRNKIELLRSQITLERQAGMLSLDYSLAELVRADLVDTEEARFRARSTDEFEQELRRIRAD